MWRGYLKAESMVKARQWLMEQGIPLEGIHTSGHASVANLKRFAAPLPLGPLVPVHSFETGRFGEYFENVVRREDGVWWHVETKETKECER